MPPGRMMSRSSRVWRSGSCPWNPRKKSCPTFSSSANRLTSFICSLPEIGELLQRLHGREVVDIQCAQGTAKFFLHRCEKWELISDDPNLSFGANREIIGQLMFVLLMFFEDLASSRRDIDRNPCKPRYLNAVAAI